LVSQPTSLSALNKATKQMQNERTSDFRKARFYSSVTLLYGLTLLFAFFAFKPITNATSNLAASTNLPVELVKAQPVNRIVSGKPLRIVISSVGIDLPVEEGRYNEFDGTWSLSGYHAQFAMMSPLANNSDGNTFIYGHNNKYVFGPIKKITPGSNAQIYTDNGRIFNYIYESTYAVTPDNTSVLDYQGPAILTVQTCSGAWNEQRQMYIFKFDKVETRQ
jgi:LPXTG-site transpeptidase (sortase) family protein